MLVQRFECQGRRFTNFRYYYYYKADYIARERKEKLIQEKQQQKNRQSKVSKYVAYIFFFQFNCCFVA